MTDCDDGWGSEYSDDHYYETFNELVEKTKEPLEMILEEVDADEFHHKFQKHIRHRKTKKEKEEDELAPMSSKVLELPDTDEEEEEEARERDHENQRRFFQPPLQVQRNDFVKNELMKYKRETAQPIKKICVMGCGEMSLERHIAGVLAAFGTETILSVDFDAPSLSVGSQIMQKTLEMDKVQIQNEEGLPVLMRGFYGDILKYDKRFGEADAIISLEVIEHIPMEDAKKFLKQILAIYRPKLFIFSTPNHDFNKAFNSPPGQFRHDDHKFELSAAEFDEWITMLRFLHPEYIIENAQYVGMIDGFEELKGATQVAVCKSRLDIGDDLLPDNVMEFKLASQRICKIGYDVVCRRMVKHAYLEWLKDVDMSTKELITGKFGFDYRFYEIKEILKYDVHATFFQDLNLDRMGHYLQSISDHKAFTEVRDGVNCMAFPEYFVRDDLIQHLENLN